MGFVQRGKGVEHGFGVFLGVSFSFLFWQRLKLSVVSEYRGVGDFRDHSRVLELRVVSGTVSGREGSVLTPWRFLSPLCTCVRDK